MLPCACWFALLCLFQASGLHQVADLSRGQEGLLCILIVNISDLHAIESVGTALRACLLDLYWTVCGCTGRSTPSGRILNRFTKDMDNIDKLMVRAGKPFRLCCSSQSCDKHYHKICLQAFQMYWRFLCGQCACIIPSIATWFGYWVVLCLYTIISIS